MLSNEHAAHQPMQRSASGSGRLAAVSAVPKMPSMSDVMATSRPRQIVSWLVFHYWGVGFWLAGGARSGKSPLNLSEGKKEDKKKGLGGWAAW